MTFRPHRLLIPFASDYAVYEACPVWHRDTRSCSIEELIPDPPASNDKLIQSAYAMDTCRESYRKTSKITSAALMRWLSRGFALPHALVPAAFLGRQNWQRRRRKKQQRRPAMQIRIPSHPAYSSWCHVVRIREEDTFWRDEVTTVNSLVSAWGRPRQHPPQSLVQSARSSADFVERCVPGVSVSAAKRLVHLGDRAR